MLVGGVAYKCWVYARTPQPLKIPIPPAPTTRRGVALRMLVEVTLFRSLFRSNKWIWLFGWLFHVALLAVLLRHLRYFTEPVWGWVALIQPVRRVRRVRHARRPRGALGAALSRRSRALHQQSLGSPDARAARGHRRERARHEVPRAHRHRRAQGVLPRPDGVRLAAASRRPGAARAPRAGRGADDRVSREQAAARAGGVLQPEPEPGRRRARAAARGRLVGAASCTSTGRAEAEWPHSRRRRWANIR